MSIYKCPVCSRPLALHNRTWKCSANHCFDIAKAGYVNLLPVNKKRSKEPGDSKSMLQSRRNFLNQGFYEPLAGALLKTLNNGLTSGSHILDIGCGEGYYLEYLLSNIDPVAGCQYAALDISKFAIQMTAKRVKQKSQLIESTVASAVDTPYQDNSFDAIYNVFAPYDAKEIGRILKPRGRFILVGPGKLHLNELSAVIYEEVRPHAGNVEAVAKNQQLQMSSSDKITTQVTIPAQLIPDMLAMTPYYWSTSETQKQKLFAMESLRVTLDFELQAFNNIQENRI